MRKKEIVAMLLAGGQGSRLGVLTAHEAKPAVAFGGKYKIIDFTLSNCINSGIDTVGVLTQYQPLKLNRHIGIGIPWDLDKTVGGVTMLPPYQSVDNKAWYSGTANAVYQNIEFIDYYNPEYVLILSGDHIYKMDYESMLMKHKQNGAEVSIAVFEVPIEEAHRFGIMVTDDSNRIIEFQEKPENPISNLASMGIYIFNWKALRENLIKAEADHEDSDFGKHILPSMLGEDYPMYSYKFEGFWKDVGTLESYWHANMQLIDLVPDFNLYEAYWKIYTKSTIQPPQFIAAGASVDTCILGEGTEVYGHIQHSVIGNNVTIEEGAVVKDSIIMSDTIIRKEAKIYRTIIAEECEIGQGTEIGIGEFAENEKWPKIYSSGLTVIGDGTTIDPNLRIGQNCAITGKLSQEQTEQGVFASGRNAIAEEVSL